MYVSAEKKKHRKNGANGVPDRNRTCDVSLRRRTLYPTEVPGQNQIIKNTIYIIIHSRSFVKKNFIHTSRFSAYTLYQEV